MITFIKIGYILCLIIFLFNIILNLKNLELTLAYLCAFIWCSNSYLLKYKLKYNN